MLGLFSWLKYYKGFYGWEEKKTSETVLLSGLSRLFPLICRLHGSCRLGDKSSHCPVQCCRYWSRHNSLHDCLGLKIEEAMQRSVFSKVQCEFPRGVRHTHIVPKSKETPTVCSYNMQSQSSKKKRGKEKWKALFKFNATWPIRFARLSLCVCVFDVMREAVYEDQICWVYQPHCHACSTPLTL